MCRMDQYSLGCFSLEKDTQMFCPTRNLTLLLALSIFSQQIIQSVNRTITKMEMFHSIALLDADSTLSSSFLVFYSSSIKDFYENVQVPKNDVQIAVNNALKLQPIQDGLLAMRLVGKHVTGSWMRLIGRAGLISGRVASPSTTDRDMPIIKRHCEDQLPGGIHWEPSEEKRAVSSSHYTTNISAERPFAVADAIIKRARNAKPRLQNVNGGHSGTLAFYFRLFWEACLQVTRACRQD